MYQKPREKGPPLCMRFSSLPDRGRHRIDRPVGAMFSVQAVYTRYDIWLSHLHPGGTDATGLW